jgi:hypothetical protein
MVAIRKELTCSPKSPSKKGKLPKNSLGRMKIFHPRTDDKKWSTANLDG